jgi:hypothetical protein
MKVYLQIRPHVIARRTQEYRWPITEIWVTQSADSARPLTVFRCQDTPEARGALLAHVRAWARAHNIEILTAEKELLP